MPGQAAQEGVAGAGGSGEGSAKREKNHVRGGFATHRHTGVCQIMPLAGSAGEISRVGFPCAQWTMPVLPGSDHQ